MALTPQLINIHQAIIDFAASAIDAATGEPLPLTNLDFSPNESPVGVDIDDTDPTDANDSLDAREAAVGATADLTMTADGPDGRKFEALVVPTVVNKDVVIEEMQIAFTERAA